MQIRLAYDPEINGGNLSRNADGSLLEDDGLATAVYVSLFTDARALPDDDVPEGASRRGCWADAFDEDPSAVRGSRLWLLQNATLTAQNLRRAEAYANEALQWMVSERVARSVSTSAVRTGLESARMATTVMRSTDQASPYQLIWELHNAMV